ncbi:eukaryotic translation initiation factor 3 subunit J-like [Rhopilema esculentum]|uniref:eukaryotic translation initiation factor 3 subunit J-like n=1 Tax=Rhopilema esculentum TaxID=499914 RepID=UPI0031D99319
MASWEDEDFEPSVGDLKGKPSDKWEGEDEDDDAVKDNWEDEDEEEETQETMKVVEKKKKKPLAERIKEKEEAKMKKLKELEEALKNEDDIDDQDLTPEERLAEKIRKQKLIEEADLLIAKDTFGVTDLPEKKTFDNFEPDTKEEFTEFQNLLVEKITKYEGKAEYTSFLEGLCRDCCAGIEVADIKRIATTLNALATEKAKIAKPAKTKKKGGKKTLVGASAKASKRDNFLDYDNQFDDFDDFM